MGLGIKTRILRSWYSLSEYRLPSLRWRLFRDTSQHGEYLALRRMLHREVPTFLVEVGANDGFRHSNSFPFIQTGWAAVLVEPNPRVFRALESRYRENPQVQTINCACGETEQVMSLHLGRDGEIGEFASLTANSGPTNSSEAKPLAFEVKVRRLTDVLESCRSPTKIGILSVDTEGFDYQVLRGLDFQKFRPCFIITEDQSPDDARKFDLLRSQGYKLRRRLGVNSIWSYGLK
jgi:FkbM family methyltransferase